MLGMYIGKDARGNNIYEKDHLVLELPDWHEEAQKLNGREVRFRVNEIAAFGTKSPTFRVRSKDPVVQEAFKTRVGCYIPFAWTVLASD